jgi:hypothetical protein
MLWNQNFIIILVSNLIAEFERKIENKTICGSETLDDQEQHLALKILTSKMTHAGRERENTPAKQYQDKA